MSSDALAIPELLDMIVTRLRHDTPALQACSAVCHSWRMHILPIMFRSLSLTIKTARGDRNFTQLAHVLNTPGNALAAHVTNVEIVSALVTPKQAKVMFSGAGIQADVAYLPASLLGAIVRPLRCLRSLTLQRITTPPTDNASPILFFPLHDLPSPEHLPAPVHLEKLTINRIQATKSTFFSYLRQFDYIGHLTVSSVLAPPIPEGSPPTSISDTSSLPLAHDQTFPHITTMIVRDKVPAELRARLFDVFFQTPPPPERVLFPWPSIVSPVRSLQINAFIPANIDEVLNIGERIHSTGIPLEHLDLDLLNHYIFWAERSNEIIPEAEWSRLHLSSQSTLRTINLSVLAGDGSPYYMMPPHVDRISWSGFFSILSTVPSTSLRRFTVRIRLVCTDVDSMHRELDACRWHELRDVLGRFISLDEVTVFLHMSERRPMEIGGREARDVVMTRLRGLVTGRGIHVDVHLAPMWSVSGAQWTFSV